MDKTMELLKERIKNEGRVLPGNILKVDSFLNAQIDVNLMNEIGKEFKRIFNDIEITKILTIEASGIAIASIAAQYFNVPVIFAKKFESINMDVDNYEGEVFSYTKQKNYKIKVSKRFLNSDDKVLILDDFIANGYAAKGLIELVESSGASVSGVGIVIEKAFQNGRKLVEEKGVRIESLVKILEFKDNKVVLA